MFWRKNKSKEAEAEQKFERAMTELVNAINQTSESQVKTEKTVTDSLTQYSESVSEIMQSFQEQLEKMEEQFELFFHRENRQSKVLQKDINHIGSRIELVFNKTDVLIKSNRDMMKEISSLKPIPVDPFNQAEPIVRNYDTPLTLDDAPLKLSKIQVVSNANSTKIYKKIGSLNYKEKQFISEIESYIKTRGAESFFFDTATNFEELESLHNLVKKLNPPLRLKDCLDCGDEFIYTHKNQLYCPKKHGITNYCKNEAKYKLSQERKS
jgi:hypothetical protein